MTYARRWQFSINEGSFPNLHVNFSTGFVYVALTDRLRWYN